MQKILVFCIIPIKVWSQFKTLCNALSWCPHRSAILKHCRVLTFSSLSFGAPVLGYTYTWIRLNSPFTQSLQKTNFLGKLWSSCIRFWVWILPFNWLEKLKETQKSVIREQLAELIGAWSVLDACPRWWQQLHGPPERTSSVTGGFQTTLWASFTSANFD